MLRNAGGWNHNIHYHDLVLRAIPENCGLALDVGCGQGLLARKLIRKCQEVVAIEVDHETIARARGLTATESKIRFVEGDVMLRPFGLHSFELITAVATLHHMPLLPALERFRDLLKPGGVLAVIGLYRPVGIWDYAWAAAALPVSWTLKFMRGKTGIEAPIQEPKQTLSEIRQACQTVLPGSVVKRRLLFRYSLIWRKP